MILIARNTKTGKGRKVELEKGEFIGVVGDHINSEEIVVKIFTKEVKKVRPYLEVEVVKVKNKQMKPKVKTLILKKKGRGEYKYKKVESNSRLYFYRCGYPIRINDEVYCYDDKEIWRVSKIIEPKSRKGNWVNGENLDKIKFPCFCSYMHGNKKSYGEINECWDDIEYKNVYTITDITKQTEGISVKYKYKSFEEMVKNRNIHILKGKIILYEEE